MKKIFLLLIVMLSFLSAACTSLKKEERKSEEETPIVEEEAEHQAERSAAKGRYREEKSAFPLFVQNIFDIQCQEDGSVKMLFENEPGSFLLCESKDSGVTWEQKKIETEWLPENYRVVSACFGSGGEIAVSAGEMSKEPFDEKHALGEYTYFRIEDLERTPLVQTLSLQLPEPKEENLKSGYGLKQILLSDKGKIYGMMTAEENEEISFRIVCFEADQGSVLWELDTEAAEIDLYEDKIYLNEFDGAVKVLDAESGSELKQLSISLRDNFLNCMDIDAKKGKIFYCNETGIYAADDQAALSELLVEGRLSSFSDMSYSIKEFFRVSEKVFLMFIQSMPGAELEVLRYEYDAGLSVQPEHELVVYSLKENRAVKKIISDFQASHPEVYVQYEVGMEDTAVKEEADAINRLNTELMAGNGPDVLVLNGLPWESYQEKEILGDFSGCLRTSIKEGDMFENIFSAYQTGDRKNIIPISFQVPALVGTEPQVSSVNSIEDLLKTTQSTADLPPFFRKNTYLLRYIFSIYWQNIEKEEGMISREALKETLEYVKKINDVLLQKENERSAFFGNEDDINYDVFDNLLDVASIKDGGAAMAAGYLSALKDFGDLLNEDLSYQTLSEGVFRALITGINRESKNIEQAEEFLLFALSDEEQNIFAGRHYPAIMGFPVNRKAYQQMISRPSQEETALYFGETFLWPNKQQFAQLEEKIINLKIPAMENSMILNIILESAAPYLAGEKTIDAAVNEIFQSLELYILEH